jgi:hypothetical protein
MRAPTVLLPALATTALFATAALAHHGFTWAEETPSELSGTIRDIYVGPPHPRLQVETADGQWTVELGNPAQTASTGFTETTAKAGDTVSVLGVRSLKAEEKRMKAIKIDLGGKEFVFYPRLLPK